MKSGSASDVKSVDVAGGWSFRGADVAEGLKLPGSRSCGRVETPRELPLRKVRASREPIRWKGEWSESRYGGREIGWRADSADGIRVPRADFASVFQ